MIDTRKYIGHTPAPWESWSDYIMQKGKSWEESIAEMDFNSNQADAQLIADAPLILQAYKKLYAGVEEILDYLNEELDDFERAPPAKMMLIGIKNNLQEMIE